MFFYGRSYDAGPYPSIHKDSAENERIAVYGILKGEKSGMICNLCANLKHKFGNQDFRAAEYDVSMVGFHTAVI